MTSATIELYDTTIGAVTWDPERELGVFEYDPSFLGSGIEVSPMTMPHELARVILAEQIYRVLTTMRGHPYPR